MTTTPPPTGRVRTPPAPQYGPMRDAYEPYPPRQSTRLANQRHQARAVTPTDLKYPTTSTTKHQSRQPAPVDTLHQPVPVKTPHQVAPVVKTPREHTPVEETSQQPASVETPRHNSTRDFFAAARSPPPTEHRKSKREPSSTEKNTGRVDALTATANYLSTHPTSSRRNFNSTTIMSDGMLPTPVKTPQKKHKIVDSSTAARLLFQPQTMVNSRGQVQVHTSIDDAVPNNKRTKKSAKYSGLSLESFMAEDEPTEGNIEIFTDSRDRIPDTNDGEDNPFLETPQQDLANKKPVRNVKKKASKTSENGDAIEESLQRDDGILYVFRGKKVFRTFKDDISETGSDSTDEFRYKRSEIKPRLLFPTEAQRRARENKATMSDEEMATDIEDNTSKLKNQNTSTPDNASDVFTSTPATPGRTLRSQTIKQTEISTNETPSGGASSKEKKASPFDSWRRLKTSGESSKVKSAPGSGRKRAHSNEKSEKSERVAPKRSRAH